MVIYRTATILDMESVAELHLECFPKTFISSFGKSLITEYYKEFFKEADLFVVAEMNGNIIGLCMGYVTGSKAKKSFVSRNKGRLIARMLILCLCFNSLVIKKCFYYIFNTKRRSFIIQSAIADADLLSICVTDNYRGQGIAYKLIHEFENLLSIRNLMSYTLSVYKNNARAIEFYKKNDLAIIEENADEYKMLKIINYDNN